MTFAATVITVSAAVSNGSRVDESGAAAEVLLDDAGIVVEARLVVPAEREWIRPLRQHALETLAGATARPPNSPSPPASH